MSHRCAGLIGLLALVQLGCASPTEPDNGALPLVTVSKSTVRNHGAQGLRMVIRDPGRWEAVWAELWGDPAPALPDVDFEREMVVVASAAMVCFADVKVEAVQQGAAGVHVTLADSGASSTCLCAAPETTFHAVRTRRVEGPVEFTARQISPTCP